MPGLPADRVAVAGMGVAVYAFQYFDDRQDRESALDGEPGLEDGSAGSVLPAGTALGAPLCQTGRAVIGCADGIDGGGERRSQFRIQGVGHAGEDRMDGRAPVSVCRPADASAGMGAMSGATWTTN